VKEETEVHMNESSFTVDLAVLIYCMCEQREREKLTRKALDENSAMMTLMELHTYQTDHP